MEKAIDNKYEGLPLIWECTGNIFCVNKSKNNYNSRVYFMRKDLTSSWNQVIRRTSIGNFVSRYNDMNIMLKNTK